MQIHDMIEIFELECGSKDIEKKDIVISIIISSVLLVIWGVTRHLGAFSDNIIGRVMQVYCFCITVTFLAWILAFILYAKREADKKNIDIKKYAYITISAILGLLFLIPIIITALCRRAKLSINTNNIFIYYVSFIVTFFIGGLGASTASYIDTNNLSYGSFNLVNIAILLALIIIWIINKIILCISFKIFKKIDSDEQAGIRGDYHIFFFALMTLCTIILNLFALSEQSVKIVQSFNAIFTIYLAFDVLHEKHKTIKCAKDSK